MAASGGPRPVSARSQRTREQVLAVLAKAGTATRAELSHRTGLSRSAISDCVAGLLADGLIVPSTEPPQPADRARTGASSRGRRAATVTLPSSNGVLLGIDLGHSHVTAAVATSAGEVLAEHSDQLDVDHQPGNALDVAAALAGLALSASGHTMDEVLGAGCGIPGPLDARTQIVRAPTILADWVDLDPAAELQRRLGRSVVVGNDADMGARGECAFGAARGMDDVLYVKASHGIGAGMVFGGRSYRGSVGIAGEIGHTQIAGATNWCRCGSRGCLETVVSISSVRRQLAHVLTTSGAVVQESKVPPLAELADNSAAARVITDAGRTVGRVLADLVNCLNPEAIVLGGELGVAGTPFVAGVRESIDRYAQPASASTVTVVAGQLGLRAELLGAIAAARDDRTRVAR